VCLYKGWRGGVILYNIIPSQTSSPQPPTWFFVGRLTPLAATTGYVVVSGDIRPDISGIQKRHVFLSPSEIDLMWNLVRVVRASYSDVFFRYSSTLTSQFLFLQEDVNITRHPYVLTNTNKPNLFIIISLGWFIYCSREILPISLMYKLYFITFDYKIVWRLVIILTTSIHKVRSSLIQSTLNSSISLYISVLLKR